MNGACDSDHVFPIQHAKPPQFQPRKRHHHSQYPTPCYSLTSSMITTAAVVPAPIMTVPSPLPLPDRGSGPLGARAFDPGFHVGLAGQRQFKRHKSLPRPRNDRAGHDIPRKPVQYDLIIDTSPALAPDSNSQPSSPRTLKHQPRRIGTGPDLPPTPPNQSRNSSSSHSALPSSPVIADTSINSHPPAVARPPATPPDQRSPPTPDVTPPQPAGRPKALRPTLMNQGTSRTTATNSRTESFKTAREDPFSSEDEGARSTVKADLTSAGTSQTTILRVPDSKSNRVIQPQALDVALERLTIAPDEIFTSRNGRDARRFDGASGSPSEVEQEWDDNLHRAVTVRKRRGNSDMSRPSNGKESVLEDNVVASTNATRAVRQMHLREAPVLNASPKRPSDRGVRSSGPSNSDSPTSQGVRKSSGVSAQSNTSAVLGVALVDGSPRRQRTLRHVRKQRTLREPTGSTPAPNVESPILDKPAKQLPANPQPEMKRRHDSYASNTTTNSISSGRARREVWKTGGVPVIVVPDRRSSHKSVSSREPSLRSTSSRRSKRPMSVGSAPLDEPLSKDTGPVFERPSRRSRRFSDYSDQRTADFPPTIPARSSSLSAPTSRNVSRTGSMTAESARALESLQHTPDHMIHEAPLIREPSPETNVAEQSPVLWNGFAGQDNHDTLGPDRYDSTTPARRYSSRNTPFSIISIETSGTAPEVSEAMAIQMYPHQNSSLVMVNHSSKPSDASDSTKKEKDVQEVTAPPEITATGPDGVPVTPPQPQYSLDEVDSPLRNPRAPPEPPSNPPAINFIPATPSGETPAHEKEVQLGNFFEVTAERPARRPSIVKRAFSRRRNSVDYPPTASKSSNLLTRTFSLSRNMRKGPFAGAGSGTNPDMARNSNYPQAEDKPVEQDKLHPFWRPHWLEDEVCDCADCMQGNNEPADKIYRYPLVDNRPRMPKRSLSARMKKTFAIMPIRDDDNYDDDNYYTADVVGPERRIIRRTPSGNLRVMRRRSSIESLKRNSGSNQRPSTSPEEESTRGFWRGHSIRRRASKERLRRSSIGSRLEEIQSIPRRLSEKRREKRTQELRQKISGPIEVRDGVDDMIRSGNTRERYNAPRRVYTKP